uniref:Ig-like domain-containing protein n=1 Tax=Ditylenchus dipsaci TaxID=166011 RepID=A0A915DFJ2_9BILA
MTRIMGKLATFSDAAPASLVCTEFDDQSHWHNNANPKAALTWYRSSVAIDPTQLQLATGTNIPPNGTYAIAATDAVDATVNSTMTANLVSDAVPCQVGDAVLSFKFWTSPFVLLTVCTKGITRPTAEKPEFCQVFRLIKALVLWRDFAFYECICFPNFDSSL